VAYSDQSNTYASSGFVSNTGDADTAKAEAALCYFNFHGRT